MSSRMGLWCTP